MGLMLRYTWHYKKYLALTLFGAAGFVLIQLGIPTLLERVLNDSLNPLRQNASLLLQLVIGMVVFGILGFGGEVCLSYANTRIANNVIRDIRADLYEKTQQFSHRQYEEFGVSALITSTTSDAYQIMIFLQTMLRTGIITPIMLISGYLMILNKSPQLSVLVLISIPLLGLGIFVIAKRSEPYSRKQQKTLDGINLTLRENLTGLRVIRAFNNESFQKERFAKVNDIYCGVSKKLFRLTTLAMPGFNILFTSIIVSVLWFGSLQVGKTLEVGTLAIFIEYFFHILFSFLMMAILFIMFPRAEVSAKRIQTILRSKTDIDENIDGVTQTETKGFLSFDHVTFAYPEDAEEPVLRDINFTAEPGQVVAFIGSTGSGKSTLIQLIPRFYDVTKGRILVDGVDVREYNIHALRAKIGFVPQKALLFTGSINENLRFGKSDATKEEIEYAADIAQASDFIVKKERQYEEHLAEGGSNMSGGQKQRLAIARAIIKKPDIYIFDDSFSALDYQTDLKLRTRMREEIQDATILIVAQRVGTIIHADKIIVLNEGEIVAEGTHKELLKTSPIYHDIASSQMTEEELA